MTIEPRKDSEAHACANWTTARCWPSEMPAIVAGVVSFRCPLSMSILRPSPARSGIDSALSAVRFEGCAGTAHVTVAAGQSADRP